MGGIKTITSRDNPGFKSLRALATEAREARRQGRALLEGPHLVAVYRDRRGRPERLVVSESGRRHGEIAELLASLAGVELLCLPDSLFREVSGLATPLGILAVIAIPESPPASGSGSRVLLDGVQDAGNVGTILRSAAAAGIAEVHLGAGCAGAWTPRVLRAAQGAHFSLAIHEQADLVGLARAAGAASLAAVADGGRSLYELDLGGEIAWIFGNEGAGVSPAVAAAAGRQVTIPMAAGTESLNVAAAAAVCLFEQVRQQRTRGGRP